MEFPKRNESSKTGRIGETYFQLFVTQELGWVFRPVHREDDFGIDGYVDILEGNHVTGRSLAVQIKCGDSYLESKSSLGWKYHGTRPHMNLYLNTSVPVVLILLSSDCKKSGWGVFDLEQTSPSDKGWCIEIPEKNRLGKEVSTTWSRIAGPTRDYSEQVQKYWAFNDFLKDTALFYVAISKAEIKRKSFRTIRSVLNRISKTPQLALESRNKVEVFFPEYQDDERELFQIPEVCAWFQQSMKAGIPWFYFLNTKGKCVSLTLLYGCGCRISIVKEAAVGFFFEVSKKERKKWLMQNFHNLNRCTEEKLIPEEVNKLATDEIMKEFMSQLEFADQELKRS